MFGLTIEKKYLHPLLSIMIRNIPRILDTEDREEIYALCRNILEYLSSGNIKFDNWGEDDYATFKQRTSNVSWDLDRIKPVLEIPYSENYMASVHGQMIFLSKNEDCRPDIHITSDVELDESEINIGGELMNIDLDERELNYMSFCMKDYMLTKGASPGGKILMDYIRHSKKI